ncbi:MAG: hypothetical protein U0Q11_07525 [Vicinamibacterales bacterium]
MEKGTSAAGEFLRSLMLDDDPERTLAMAVAVRRHVDDAAGSITSKWRLQEGWKRAFLLKPDTDNIMRLW